MNIIERMVKNAEASDSFGKFLAVVVCIVVMGLAWLFVIIWCINTHWFLGALAIGFSVYKLFKYALTPTKKVG